MKTPNANPPRSLLSENENLGGHWSQIAQRWSQVGAPLRPSAEDITIYSDVVASMASQDKTVRALILGATPELCRLNWPSGSSVLALDHTHAMLDHVWPGPRNAAICGDWTRPPLTNASCDIVLCDGGFHLLSPDGQRALVRSIFTLLAPGGLFVVRLFAPPAQRETSKDVLADLLAARIGDLNILKLRLGMALQESPEAGVELHQVWCTLAEAAPSFSELARRAGWSLEHLSAVDSYRNSHVRYHFRSLDEVRLMFCDNPGGFEVTSVDVPTYALGERCPTVVFRRSTARPA